MNTISSDKIADVVKSNSLVNEKLLRDSMELSQKLGGTKSRQFNYRLAMPFSRRLKTVAVEGTDSVPCKAIKISR